MEKLIRTLQLLMFGFIALAGVSVQMGMVLVGIFNQLRVRGMPLHEAVIEGSKTRLRPVLRISRILHQIPGQQFQRFDPCRSSVHFSSWHFSDIARCPT